MNRRFKAYRARFGLVALAGALVVMALVPATASAGHFSGSTKECNQPGICVLTINVVASIPESDTVTVELASFGTTGAAFRTATRTGGTCPPTAVSLVDSRTIELDPSADMTGCSIVLEETLAATSAGEVCQEVFSNFSSGTFACAQLTPAECSDSADNDRDGRTDFPADPGCASATDNDETDPPPARQCSDGRDNDRDGRTDYPRDPGCSSANDDNESDPRPANPCTIKGTGGQRRHPRDVGP
ncbi:MAG TPA: hypothetical protein VGV57_04490 [Thermoleophilaceae bacterium]|nr:hypothetical protein [Thermoleophilaceae bacterium]